MLSCGFVHGLLLHIQASFRLMRLNVLKFVPTHFETICAFTTSWLQRERVGGTTFCMNNLFVAKMLKFVPPSPTLGGYSYITAKRLSSDLPCDIPFFEQKEDSQT